MSPKGRPEGEYLSAQREGAPFNPPGRPRTITGARSAKLLQ
jgi:16S rRNA (guanine527-N7)-methyltransferase